MDPVAQGRGVGRALLAQVEVEVQERGGRLLLIETSDGSAYGAARRLYETCGYSREATIHDFYAPGDSLLIYAKRLEPVQPPPRIFPESAKRTEYVGVGSTLLAPSEA